MGVTGPVAVAQKSSQQRVFGEKLVMAVVEIPTQDESVQWIGASPLCYVLVETSDGPLVDGCGFMIGIDIHASYEGGGIRREDWKR